MIARFIYLRQGYLLSQNGHFQAAALHSISYTYLSIPFTPPHASPRRPRQQICSAPRLQMALSPFIIGSSIVVIQQMRSEWPLESQCGFPQDRIVCNDKRDSRQISSAPLTLSYAVVWPCFSKFPWFHDTPYVITIAAAPRAKNGSGSGKTLVYALE